MKLFNFFKFVWIFWENPKNLNGFEKIQGVVYKKLSKIARKFQKSSRLLEDLSNSPFKKDRGKRFHRLAEKVDSLQAKFNLAVDIAKEYFYKIPQKSIHDI